MAKHTFDAFRAGLQVLGSEEGKQMARGELDRVVAATNNVGERTQRHIEDILERNGHFKQRHGPRGGDP